MYKIINSGIFIALISALATWLLADIKFKDSINIIDYTAGGVELINLQDKLTNTLKIQANDKTIEKLNIYNIRFSNNSNKNLERLKIEFKADNLTNGELIASAVKGPDGYSDSLIHKINETKDSAIYEIEFINVAKNTTDFFTASFLFINSAPESVKPKILNSGITFENTKDSKKIIFLAIFVIFAYVGIISGFFYWISYQTEKGVKKKQQEYEEELKFYLIKTLSITDEKGTELAVNISSLRESIFKPKQRFKRFLNDWLNSENKISK